MTREIKFRIWDNEHNQFLSRKDLNNFNISPIDGHVLYIDDSDCVDRLELTQYTGLKDKNGKEIYEGDICKLNDLTGYTYVIEYKSKDEAKFLAMNQGKGCERHGLAGVMFEHLTIIGNIYDNPELLKDHS